MLYKISFPRPLIFETSILRTRHIIRFCETLVGFDILNYQLRAYDPKILEILKFHLTLVYSRNESGSESVNRYRLSNITGHAKFKHDECSVDMTNESKFCSIKFSSNVFIVRKRK